MDLQVEAHSLCEICQCLDSFSFQIVQVEGYVDLKLGVECHFPSCEGISPSSIRLCHRKVLHPISREIEKDGQSGIESEREIEREGERGWYFHAAALCLATQAERIQTAGRH